MKTLEHMPLAVASFIVCVGFAGHVRAVPTTHQVLSITAPWRYTTNNVDAADWTLPSYSADAWSGPGNALFYIETASLPAAKNTPLPPQQGGAVQPCYYFRTSFNVTNVEEVCLLTLSHLVDDGAVFYLNGVEIGRVRINAGAVSYTTQANSTPSGGDAKAYETLTVVGELLRTNLVEGTNLLAARVHQNGTVSSDVVFGAKVAAVYDPDPIPQLTRGPYLQVCTPASVRIRWRTDLAEDSEVRCGAEPSALNLVYGDGSATVEHEVLVTNLTPDTLYYYSIGSSSRVLTGGSDGTCLFRTHPLPGSLKPLRIWVTGDAGTGNANAQAVRDAFETLNGSCFVDAWLQLGDNAYDSGTDAQYQSAMFNMYACVLRQTCVWTTMANHETYSTDPNGLYPYLNNFSMPLQGEAGGVPSGTQLYFSFDIGLAHFISLDATDSDRSSEGDMANWLRNDLAATTSRWVIAYFHQPPYTKGSHDSDVEGDLIDMRENLLPILEAGGVDLVLNGHSHCYERSYLLNGHYGYSATLTSAMLLNAGDGRPEGDGAYCKPKSNGGPPARNRGTVYVVVGCSGKTSGGALNHPAMFRSQNTLGSLVLDVTPEHLEARYLRETGTFDDGFMIVKTNAPPVASRLSFAVEADRSSALQLAATDAEQNPVSFAVNAAPQNGLITAFDAVAGSFVYTPARGCTNGDTFAFTADDGQYQSEPGLVTLTFVPPADSDQNGLPDDWETTYAVTDPAGDADDDGASNLQEYQAGTDPKNAASWLRMTPSDRVASGFRVSWSSVGGTRYRIFYSNGDTRGGFNGAFVPLARTVADEMDPNAYGSSGTMSFTDDFALTGFPPHGCRYYRVRVVQ